MQVREGGLATAEGVSYLEAKHLLLLHYCLHLLFYLLLKAEGRPVTNHPVIARLVEIRTYLEKIRPLDKRLKYQTDKLLAAAAAVQVRFNQLRLADGGMSASCMHDAGSSCACQGHGCEVNLPAPPKNCLRTGTYASVHVEHGQRLAVMCTACAEAWSIHAEPGKSGCRG